MANDNTELGRFDLVGLPPAPRGIPQIEVTFDIDANGIVHVHAKDLGTGKEQSIKITAPKKLSKEDIDKMVKEAEKFAEEDKKKKEEVETVNQADTLCYTVEKSLKDYGNKISASEKENIEKKLKEAKEVIAAKDVSKIKKVTEELAKASHKLAEEVYKDAQKKQAQAKEKPKAGKGKPADGKKDDVVDAEYKVEDEDKDKPKGK
jgi:molecular chaperone DnaK